VLRTLPSDVFALRL